MSETEILVSIQLGNETCRVGTLWCHQRGGRQSASFTYDASWMHHSERFAIDPALQLTLGSFHTADSQLIFGAIGDSSPDRWGRVLMRRAEQNRAVSEGKTPRTLQESDYLLGVHDEARIGALRFSLKPDGPFLAESQHHPIPPLIQLPQLLGASERYLADRADSEDIRLLLLPGSSLGGARPKASIVDNDGSLALAKFPRKDDEFSVVVWEAVALALAERAGINTVHWRLEKVLGKPVLVIKRFDRNGKKRIPFLSAMSMLEAQDRERHSYLEMAYALTQHGANPSGDMEELWRRIVFTILISNTDDHLRNHGFLYRQNRGWELSPAYDLNPVSREMSARFFSTSIGFNTPHSSIPAALSVIDEFRIPETRAQEILQEVAAAAGSWLQVASEFGLGSREIERMASAFEHEDMQNALSR